MTHYAYIAIGGENKLLIYEMDTETGTLTPLDEVALSGAPGPLAFDPQQQFLYAGLRSTREIASFRIDADSGRLTPIGTVSLDADPCYMSTDRRGRFLLSAYYGAGQVTVHPIGEDGDVGGSAIVSLPTAEHAHCIQTDASNRFAFVPHTAEPNRIFQFEFDEETGVLTPNAEPKVIPEEGVGPRHFVFHPAQDVLYFSNEQGSSVTAYRFNSATGTLTPFQTLSTLPAGYDGENTGAQIHIHPSRRFLYASNRGHDSIACFAIDPNSGELTARGHQPTEPIPRVFNLDPAGRFLFAAGQGSGRLAAYRIDGETGSLQPMTVYPVGERPMWVQIL